MTRDDLLALREEFDFEAKAAQGRDGRGEVPRSVWQTYSAMANTAGGRILLGAEERSDGSLDLNGIADAQRVRKTLWDALNNRQIVSHNLLGKDDIEVMEVEGMEHPLLLITVPAVTRQQRPVYVGDNPLAGTYRRNFEGDYRCGKHEVRQMLAEAERDTRDSEVLKGFDLRDLDPHSLAAYRNLFRSTKPGHPWLGLDDRELLRRLGGWRTDRERDVEGPTLAGLLMFGLFHTIRDALPSYILDYQERADPQIRWTDRVTTDETWSGNLFDFYRRIYPRLVEGLKVPFRLEAGAHRVDETPVHEALREALVNSLIHADYYLSTGILVIRYPDRFEFRNPGGLRIPRALALQGGVSDCRNRNLRKMFQMIGEGEQAGSGVPRILSAWRGQHWRAPLLEEHAQPDMTILHLSMISLFPPEDMENLVRRFGAAFQRLDEVERLALATASVEGQVTNERLREISGEHPSDLTALFRRLVQNGFLERRGRRRRIYYQLPSRNQKSGGRTDYSGTSVVQGATSTGPAIPHLPASAAARQQKAIQWIRDHGSISNEKYRRLTGATRRTATRDLQQLVERKVLRKVGELRWTRYVLSAGEEDHSSPS